MANLNLEFINNNLPHGFDVRDCLAPNGLDTTKAEGLEQLEKLLSLYVLVPEEWLREPQEKKTSKSVTCLPCNNYRKLINSWRLALKWVDGLDVAMSVMLASITSTKMIGDQLWIKIIGPASCGKSTLCEALTVNSKYVIAKSTIRGFHSGFSSTDGKDHSLISKVKNKTLITKDGDTLLQSPNLGQVLSEARDIYDTVSRTSYRNKASKDYSGVRMTWLLCGTSSLRSLDSSELGERFLDCVIMDGIDDELEDEILWRVVNRADRNICIEADGKPETHQEPEMTKAMQLTGGYVDHLRNNAPELLSQVVTSRESLKRIQVLGKFVAFMRARPSRKQTEHAEREFAARLVSQLLRLGKCLAAVLNRKTMDGEVMRRVRKVALDTSRGKTMQIMNQLYPVSGDAGLNISALEIKTQISKSELSWLLRFLKGIDAIEMFKLKSKNGKSGRGYRYRLTRTMYNLYKEVVIQ